MYLNYNKASKTRETSILLEKWQCLNLYIYHNIYNYITCNHFISDLTSRCVAVASWDLGWTPSWAPQEVAKHRKNRVYVLVLLHFLQHIHGRTGLAFSSAGFWTSSQEEKTLLVLDKEMSWWTGKSSPLTSGWSLPMWFRYTNTYSLDRVTGLFWFDGPYQFCVSRMISWWVHWLLERTFCLALTSVSTLGITTRRRNAAE